MDVLFCKKCGSALRGKQRLHCSDKCRKALSRKPDASRTNVHSKELIDTTNSKTANIFSQFSDVLSGLTPAGIRQLKMHLGVQAEYSDVCVGRLANMTHMLDQNDAVEGQQALSAILYRLLDDLAAIEVTG